MRESRRPVNPIITNVKFPQNIILKEDRIFSKLKQHTYRRGVQV